MRRKMFIKNIVYKKWYIIFCVYAIFINLCKKNTNLSQRPKFFESQNFLHFFIFFSFKAHRERKKFYFSTNFNKFQLKSSKYNARKRKKRKKHIHKHKKQKNYIKNANSRLADGKKRKKAYKH